MTKRRNPGFFAEAFRPLRMTQRRVRIGCGRPNGRNVHPMVLAARLTIGCARYWRSNCARKAWQAERLPRATAEPHRVVQRDPSPEGASKQSQARAAVGTVRGNEFAGVANASALKRGTSSDLVIEG